MSYASLASALLVLALGAACAPDAPTGLQAESLLASKGNSENTPAAMNRMVADVRAATAKYHRVDLAEADGYVSTEECVAHPELGAMGVHFVNSGLTGDGSYGVRRPEMLMYEPQVDGSMKLIGAVYLIFRVPWEAKGDGGIPMFADQSFDVLFGEAAHGLPDHYELHLWLWRHNPSGVFYPWNRNVQCPAHE